MESSGRIHSGFRSIEIRTASTSPSKSPKKQETILEEELLIRQDAPHPVHSKKILPLRFLFSLVQSIARLISQVCGGAPPHITQGLYEEILLGSSNKKIVGSTESALLEFLCNFFKKSPHLEKESILKELSQAASWAKKIETSSVLFVDKTFKAVAKEIAEQIGKLTNGESCILPGGALATFRITKEGDTYRLEVFSRHPDFPGLEWVEAGGKKKVRGCLLQGIPLDALSNPSWIEGFLRAAQEGEPESYNKVVLPFASFLVPSKDANLPFHASKEGLCRIQNVWDLVHRGESGKRNLHRRKISLQLEALYGFFQQQKSDLHTDSVAYLYLKKGVEKVARTALAIGDDLTHEEKEKIQNDLYAIDTYLKSLIPQPSKRSIPKSPKSSPLSLAFPCIKTQSPSVSSDPVRLVAKALPLSGPYAGRGLVYQSTPTPDLSSRKACINALKALKQKMQDKQFSSTEKLQELVQMGLLLPLPSSSTQREAIQKKQPVISWMHEDITKEDMWYGSVDDVQAKNDAEETAALLTELSTQLYTLLQQRPNIAPRHFLALTKYATLTGKLTKYFSEQGIIKEFPDLLNLIQDLYYGANLDEQDFFRLKRPPLSHSIYLCQTETEQAALEQLKNYALPQFSQGPWHTQDGARDWNDPLHPENGIKPGPIALGLATQLKNFLKLVKAEPYRNNITLKDIVSLLHNGEKHSKPSLGHFSREWLQEFQNPLLMAIFYGFRLDKGKTNEQADGEDNCIFTQEAIMGYPWQAVEKAFQTWQKDLPDTEPLKKQLFQEGWAKRALENLLSEEQLKELLIAMSPSNSSWDFLAFFKQNPSTLEHPAMQAILERLILQPGSLQASCKADPTFPKFLSEFFKYYLKQSQQKQTLSSYLFLHRLSRRCTCLLSSLAKETVFPQQLPQIRQWKNASAQPLSPLAPFRQQLLSEFLEILGSQPQLSDASIGEYLVASAEMQSVSSAKGLSPAEQDLLQQQYCSWLPQIKEAIQKDVALLKDSLDKICALRGISLPIGHEWAGTFPVYRTGDWEVDLSSLRVVSLGGDILPTAWPAEVLGHSDFQKAFPSFDPLQHPCFVCKKGQNLYYKSTDPEGQTQLVEQKPDGRLSFFLSSQETGHQWAEYIPCPKELGTITADHRLYVQGNKGWLVDRQGHFQFIVGRVSTSRTGVHLDQLQACRPTHPITERMRGTFFDPVRYAELAPLLQLSSQSDIILWKEGSHLRHVELRNSGLLLTLQNGNLISTHPSLKGYKLDLQTPPPFGLAIGALFVSQDPTQRKAKWVLPHFGGKYELNPLPHQNKKSLLKLLFGSPSAFFTANHHSISQKWRWKWNQEQQPGIWTFDVDPTTLSILSAPEKQQGCVDLLKQSLFACSTAPHEAFLAANQALEQLELFPSNAISPDEMETLFKDLQQLPKKARLLESQPAPELLTILLRTGLKMCDRATPSLKARWNRHMSKLIPLYFKMGRNLSEETLLSPKEEQLSLALMREYNEAWFNTHEPLLRQFHPHLPKEARTIPPISIVPFTPSLSPLHTSSKNVLPPKLDSIMLGMVKNRSTSGDSDPKTVEGTARRFKDLYNLAKTGNIEEVTAYLPKLQALVRSLGDISEKQLKSTLYAFHSKATANTRHWERTTHDALHCQTIVRYLEAVFECRARDPKIKLPKFTDSYDFPDELHKALQESQKKALQSPEIPLSIHSTMKPIQLEGIGPIDIVGETSSKSTKETRKKIDLTPQIGSALIAQDSIQNLFREDFLAYSFSQLHLDQLIEVPAVQKTKEKLEEEISSLEQQKSKIHLLKTDFAQQALAYVKSEQARLAPEAAKAREAIDAYIKAAMSQDFLRLRELGGQRPHISWPECLEAYLQNDFSMLQAKLKELDVVQFKQRMKEFFLLETRRRHAGLAIRELSEFLAVPALQQSSSAQEKLYEILSRPRSFDPEVYPQLLVMEYSLGFLLKREQLQMGIDFVENPHCIRQAVTGAGKTSAILPFVGLMKANGSNLVTLKFLDPLFDTNLAAVQKLLGGLKKKAVPLLFSADTPLVVEKVVGKQSVQESVFKEMYETVQKVTLQKGCLITNKKTQPLLQAKFIELYHKLCFLPEGSYSAIDQEHLRYLSKLLNYFREREETLYDEFDKFLSPKEELHLRIEAGPSIPKFVSTTALEIFDELLKNKTLALTKNGQDNLSKTEQAKILTDTAQALAQSAPKDLPREKLTAYLLSNIKEDVEKDLLGILGKMEPAARDKIALQKDLLKILSTTLFKAADKDYIRSKRDGESVIPCAYADVPKEGSEYDDVRVKLCYLIQYVYQKGVGAESFSRWVKDLKERAEKSLANGEYTTLQETVEEQFFKTYFPDASLGSLTPETLTKLHGILNQDSLLLRRFLSVMTEKLCLPGTRISLNPHNQVSIAKSSAGTSATLGSVEGLHRSFDKDLGASTAQAQMIHRLLKRVGDKKPIHYDPTHPSGIVKQLLEQEPSSKVLIDGAGALRGVPGEDSASKLKELQTDLRAVTYFALNGQVQTVGEGAPQETGCIYSHAQARGADRSLPVDHRAILIVNGRTPQEEVSQNEGRLRKEDQPLTLAVPQGSSIKDVGDLINEGLVQQTHTQAELLFLSKQQELQDIVRNAIVDLLVKLTTEENFDQAAEIYQDIYENTDLLTSTHSEDWEVGGTYYEYHAGTERECPPLDAIKNSYHKYLTIAEKHGLKQIEQELTAFHTSIQKLKDLLPATVSSSLETDKEAQVEVEIETEVTTEVETEVDVEAETARTRPSYYLGWNWNPGAALNETPYTEEFSAFDPDLFLSPNFAPLERNAYAPPVHQRSLHDPKQSHLRYIKFQKNSSPKSYLPHKATALDQLDYESYLTKLQDPDFCDKLSKNFNKIDLYDTVLNRYIIGGKALSEEDHKKRVRWIAQMRFADGQWSGYTDEEWMALESWIQEQENPSALEAYFLQQVLKFRPKERERYPLSPLGKLFSSMKSKRK